MPAKPEMPIGKFVRACAVWNHAFHQSGNIPPHTAEADVHSVIVKPCDAMAGLMRVYGNVYFLGFHAVLFYEVVGSMVMRQSR